MHITHLHRLLNGFRYRYPDSYTNSHTGIVIPGIWISVKDFSRVCICLYRNTCGILYQFRIPFKETR